MALVRRFDHVGITVRDLRAVTSFFLMLGLEPDGEPQVAEGRWLDDVIGIDDACTEIVMLRVPGGDTSLELSQFRRPAGGPSSPAAASPDEPGLRSVAFEVDDLQATLTRVREAGFDLVRSVARYEDVFELCYVRGPEGIIVMLAEKLD